VGEVDAAFDEHASGADRFRIFGDERTLLRGRRSSQPQRQSESGTHESTFH
jgi:hypothetical protein